MMYDWLIYFISGWFGAHWWPGIEKDAPGPGPNPEPWWTHWVSGVVGGLIAIFVVRLTGLTDATPAILLSIGTGRVVSTILAPVIHGRAKR
jgi:hypothetical protein